MAATDRFHSLDQTIADIKEQHNSEMTDLDSKLRTAQIENELLRNALKRAEERALVSERLAIKLVTQFGTVEQVFSEAKKLALQVDACLSPEKPDLTEAAHAAIDEALATSSTIPPNQL